MPPARQPWPMKWIVLAIVVLLPLYTFLTLHFRKPGPAYEPFRDSQQRARLEQAGYSRISLHPEWPSDPKPLRPDVAIAPAAGGLPADLRATFFTAPLLPAEIGAVEAGPVASDTEPYRVRFLSTLDDNHQVLADAKIYFRPGQLYIVPTCEPLAGGLTARSRSVVTELSVNAGALPAGTYRATLVGARAARTWTVQVH
jgi:hypothetical protein